MLFSPPGYHVPKAPQASARSPPFRVVLPQIFNLPSPIAGEFLLFICAFIIFFSSWGLNETHGLFDKRWSPPLLFLLPPPRLSHLNHFLPPFAPILRVAGPFFPGHKSWPNAWRGNRNWWSPPVRHDFFCPSEDCCLLMTRKRGEKAPLFHLFFVQLGVCLFYLQNGVLSGYIKGGFSSLLLNVWDFWKGDFPPPLLGPGLFEKLSTSLLFFLPLGRASMPFPPGTRFMAFFFNRCGAYFFLPIVMEDYFRFFMIVIMFVLFYESSTLPLFFFFSPGIPPGQAAEKGSPPFRKGLFSFFFEGVSFFP